MFKASLFKFQEEAEESLLKACYEEHREMVLYAPTGSGKTVIASKFIDDYLDENPNTVFLWTCPGAGDLEEQSRDSFSNVTEGITVGDVYSFIREPNPAGNVYFINWEKINKSNNVVLRETEYNNLREKVLACHNDKVNIFVVVDEEHKNKDSADEFIADVDPKHILRISATPISDVHCIKIEDDAVIASGLIASGISINENVSKNIDEDKNANQDLDLMLIERADEKRKEIQAEYDKLGLSIRPLVVIQFPNGKPEWIQRVKDKLTEMGYGDDSGLVTTWITGDHPDNPEELKKLDGQYSFLLFKQAVSTGWDCPRAKILVKLREGGSETFNVQTIGRIRRMPERHHYSNDILDNCYIYTLDTKFKEGLTSALTDSFYTASYKRKEDIPQFVLEKEYLDRSDEQLPPDTRYIIEVVRDRMLDEYDLNKNGELDREELEAHGYIFGTTLKAEAIEGTARTTKDLLSLNTIFKIDHEINTHDDGFIIRDAKRKIASAIGIKENYSNNVLRILFGPEEQDSLLTHDEYLYEQNSKLVKGMSLKEFNAFLVNNRDKLVEVFEKINKEDIIEYEESPIQKMDWYIPEDQYYKFHRRIDKVEDMTKNAFDDYGDNIIIKPNRSQTEIEFEKRCEMFPNVKRVYKNGDKGLPYFSIVYRIGFKRSNFYPDYIIQTTDGNIWIIEAKGGTDRDGNSANIDKLATNKFEALKDYGERHPDIKWGFVRYDTYLYVSNTEWDENIRNKDVRKRIDQVLK